MPPSAPHTVSTSSAGKRRLELPTSLVDDAREYVWGPCLCAASLLSGGGRGGFSLNFVKTHFQVTNYTTPPGAAGTSAGQRQNITKTAGKVSQLIFVFGLFGAVCLFVLLQSDSVFDFATISLLLVGIGRDQHPTLLQLQNGWIRCHFLIERHKPICTICLAGEFTCWRI